METHRDLWRHMLDAHTYIPAVSLTCLHLRWTRGLSNTYRWVQEQNTPHTALSAETSEGSAVLRVFKSWNDQSSGVALIQSLRIESEVGEDLSKAWEGHRSLNSYTELHWMLGYLLENLMCK